jgi:hypothetical protein
MPWLEMAYGVATVLGLYGLSLLLIDDVLEQARNSPWVRAHEDIGRRGESEDDPA